MDAAGVKAVLILCRPSPCPSEPASINRYPYQPIDLLSLRAEREACCRCLFGEPDALHSFQDFGGHVSLCRVIGVDWPLGIDPLPPIRHWLDVPSFPPAGPSSSRVAKTPLPGTTRSERYSHAGIVPSYSITVEGSALCYSFSERWLTKHRCAETRRSAAMATKSSEA